MGHVEESFNKLRCRNKLFRNTMCLFHRITRLLWYARPNILLKPLLFSFACVRFRYPGQLVEVTGLRVDFEMG